MYYPTSVFWYRFLLVLFVVGLHLLNIATGLSEELEKWRLDSEVILMIAGLAVAIELFFEIRLRRREPRNQLCWNCLYCIRDMGEHGDDVCLQCSFPCASSRRNWSDIASRTSSDERYRDQRFGPGNVSTCRRWLLGVFAGDLLIYYWLVRGMVGKPVWVSWLFSGLTFILFFGAFLADFFVERRLHRRAIAEWHCWNCQYILDGLPERDEGRCPECGFDRKTSRQKWIAFRPGILG